MNDLGFATRAIHSGQKPDPTTGAIVVPIYQTTTYVHEDVDVHKGYTYTRDTNPTVRALEILIADLEGGLDATAFSSGMAGILSIMYLLEKGDHVIISDVVYGGTPRLCNQVLVKYGLEFSYVDTSDPDCVRKSIKVNTKMIFIETPANPTMKITDMEEINKIAKEYNILFVVDNTFATPYFQQPFKFGADLIVHSTTKYLEGHNSSVGGVVVCNNKEIDEKLKFLRKSIGACLSPFNAWLTIMGIKTLTLRMEKHNSNAMEVAKFLETHKKVKKVYYPLLPNHPQYLIVKKQMKGVGGMLSFELDGDVNTCRKFMRAIKLCSLAESLGAVETLISYPAAMTHSAIPKEDRERLGITDTLIRISVGLEDVKDIIADLSNALDMCDK